MNAAQLPIPRIVLDTNVCLDLFLFHDSACALLLAALERGEVLALTRDDCRDEWRRVLHYPQLSIDIVRVPALEAAFDRLVRRVPAKAAPGEDSLPRCADPDDQKFLELALAEGARWLLSKDNELLKLDRRMCSAGLFRILRPQDWPESIA
ncbi:MAG: putative toxin-antitoxin system toxin component, PIN family [Rhodanobacter sp.]